MKQIMAVYDADVFYARRFADVVNRKEKIPFEVVAFSTMEKLQAYGAKEHIALLLVGNSVPRSEAEKVGAEKIMVLTEGESVLTEREYPGVYKYQSSDSIVREVMACYGTGAVPREEGGSRAVVYGIYSPIARCLKTSFSITLGKLLAEDGRTLYINLEEFSGLSVLTGTEYRTDLSDLLYYARSGTFNVLRLSGVVHTMGNLDYIPPVRCPEDLEEAGDPGIVQLLDLIISGGGYDNLVVDVGDSRKRAVPVLERCSVIYMPVKEDGVSLAKLQEFDRFLEDSGNSGLQDRIRRLKLPYHSSFGRKENYLDQLLWGELGDYTRQLLRGKMRM